MKKFTTKTIKLPKDVDEKYSQMNYLKEISKNIDDVKDGEKDDFVSFGHIEPLYLKNCIKHFEYLPENITNFIIKNYDVNKFNEFFEEVQFFEEPIEVEYSSYTSV